MNLTDSIIEYRRYLRRRNFSSHTIINYLSSIKQFVLWIDVPVETVTDKKVAVYVDYLLDRKMSPQSINSNLYRIRGFYDFLQYEKKLLIKNPAKKHCGLRLPKPLPRYLRDEDVERLFNVITKARDDAMFRIMLRCGLRVEEVSNLTKEVIDLKRQQLIVLNGKGKKGRVAYISNDAHKALLRYLKQRSSSRVKKIFLVEKGTYRGKPISVRGIKKRMEYYAKKSGVKVSCHSLRHTMATQMLNADTRLTIIQVLLGHDNITTTERYSKVYDAKAKRDYFSAMDRIGKRASEQVTSESGYGKFFTQARRLQVSKNFKAVNAESGDNVQKAYHILKE
jgi:site-specific recombinase XerD